MTSGISSGNYPPEIWPKTVACVEKGNVTDWVDLVYGNPPKEIDPPFFLVIDIHGFSDFCEECAKQGEVTGSNLKEVSKLLRAFFLKMADYIHFSGGTCIKFIGDAILAIHKDEAKIRKLGKQLLIRYKNDFMKTYPDTDVIIVITRPKQCLRGFVASSDYVDYSYWGPGLNYLFKVAKTLPHGRTYYVGEDGKANSFRYKGL